MRKALLAAAVTSGVVATRRRGKPTAPAVPTPGAASPLPAQRTPLVEGDAELSVSEQEAEDDRILALLDRL